MVVLERSGLAGIRDDNGLELVVERVTDPLLVDGRAVLTTVERVTGPEAALRALVLHTRAVPQDEASLALSAPGGVVVLAVQARVSAGLAVTPERGHLVVPVGKPPQFVVEQITRPARVKSQRVAAETAVLEDRGPAGVRNLVARELVVGAVTHVADVLAGAMLETSKGATVLILPKAALRSITSTTPNLLCNGLGLKRRL